MCSEKAARPHFDGMGRVRVKSAKENIRELETYVPSVVTEKMAVVPASEAALVGLKVVSFPT